MITLINPNLVVLKNDVFTTGIVYMPIALCSLAANLSKNEIKFKMIDSFGLAPNLVRQEQNFLLRGLDVDEVISLVPIDSKLIFLYAINLASHKSVVEILLGLKKAYPHIPVVILENTQAVTAYSLRQIQEEFYEIGADFILTGEAESRGLLLSQNLINGEGREKLKEIDGLGFKYQNTTHYLPPSKNYLDLDQLPIPSYELLPLENYWALKYAHGPFETKKYLPILTSRGCPYPCKFCVIPETNSLRWRSRSAKNIVDEMEFFYKNYGVSEFHIEDVDPTVSDQRTREFCHELIARKLPIIWKICAGTKVETMRSEDTIELMAKAGCRYISISPETGSPRILKSINKPFNLDHAIKLVAKMNKVGIHSQACFVLGYPGEEDSDRILTKLMVKQLTKVGVDEIALFVITPVPGSEIFAVFKRDYTDYSQLNFSPTWREDYEKLNHFRIGLYRNFLWWKLIYQPFKMLVQPSKFLFKHFETKMEMTPYRALHTLFVTYFLPKLRKNRVFSKKYSALTGPKF